MTQELFPPNTLNQDGDLNVSVDPSPLIADTFDTTVDTTDRWTTGGTVPTASAGTLTISPSTTALAVSSIVSKTTFGLLGNMYNAGLGIIKTDATDREVDADFYSILEYKITDLAARKVFQDLKKEGDK